MLLTLLSKGHLRIQLRQKLFQFQFAAWLDPSPVFKRHAGRAVQDPPGVPEAQRLQGSPAHPPVLQRDQPEEEDHGSAQDRADDSFLHHQKTSLEPPN